MSIIQFPLEFERPLVELEITLERLKDQIVSGDDTKKDEYSKLLIKVSKLKSDIYGKLTPYQRVQLSRHFDRPFTLDYISLMLTDFLELHGDRCFRDDPAIVGGTGKLGTNSVMIVGHQRGRTTQERLQRNFGMSQPDGYRKALRLFKLAEKFGIPIITLIDTQGAFPGIEAEERGQAQAIAQSIQEMSEFTVPIISVVIGEGGSGGALALGVSDRILMLENACYSVITPEGCASILWHQSSNDAPQSQAAMSAEMLKLTAVDLKKLGIIDTIIPEPEGGAHRNHKEMAESLKLNLIKEIDLLSKLTVKDLLDGRYNKFRAMGPFSG